MGKKIFMIWLAVVSMIVYNFVTEVKGSDDYITVMAMSIYGIDFYDNELYAGTSQSILKIADGKIVDDFNKIPVATGSYEFEVEDDIIRVYFYRRDELATYNTDGKRLSKEIVDNFNRSFESKYEIGEYYVSGNKIYKNDDLVLKTVGWFKYLWLIGAITMGCLFLAFNQLFVGTSKKYDNN
ncbi:MAG: hypothetical protein N4A62_07025 [Marinisporobacter sp.]|jgi:hypothetical protein|nr:hypothetical protein [Marinisporobacter sp.]